MTDTAKLDVWSAVWSPWGAAQSITGTATLNARFPGQWFQLEAGLHYNWHRHYDPSLGRYTQPDPLGFVDGPSVYGYVKGAPQSYVDPDGRFVWTWPAIRLVTQHVIWPTIRPLITPAITTAITALNLGSGGGGGGKPPTSGKPGCPDDDDQCYEQYLADLGKCAGSVRMIYGKRGYAICKASAGERLAACYSGKSIPPLDLWDRPL